MYFPTFKLDLPLSSRSLYFWLSHCLSQSFPVCPIVYVFFTFSPLSIVGLSFLAFSLSMILPLSLSFQPKISYLPPVLGVIQVRVSIRKKDFIKLKLGLQGIYILRIVKSINKDDLFSFQPRLVRIDKF
jgi:hypothetical protein